MEGKHNRRRLLALPLPLQSPIENDNDNKISINSRGNAYVNSFCFYSSMPTHLSLTLLHICKTYES